MSLKPLKLKPNCMCPNCLSFLYLYDDLEKCRNCNIDIDWTEMFSDAEIEKAKNFSKTGE